MESAMRQRLGKRVWKTILWLLLFSLAGSSVLGIFYQVFGHKKESNLVAKVGNLSISHTDVAIKAKDIQEMVRVIRTQAREHAELILRYNGLLGEPQALALASLVDEAIKLYAAQKSGFSVISDVYATEKLRDKNFLLSHAGQLFPTYLFQEFGIIDQNALESFFRRTPGAAERFDTLYPAVLKRDLIESVMTGVPYSPQSSHIWEQTIQAQEKTFEIFEVSEDAIKNDIVTKISPDALKAFFTKENKQKRYWSEEKRAGRVYTFSPSDYGVSISDVALRKYFAQHANSEFKGKTFDAVKESILNRLLQDQFSRLFSIEAKNHLNTKDSKIFLDYIQAKKAKTSVLPLANKNDKMNRVQSALFSISTVGSRAFVLDESGAGVLIELTQLESSVELPFEQVKKDVERDLISFMLNQELALAQEKILASMPYTKDGKSPSILNSYHAKQKKQLKISPNDTAAWEKLKKEGYPTERMQRMGHVGYAVASILPEQKSILIIVLIEAVNSVKNDIVLNRFAVNTNGPVNTVFEEDVLATFKKSVTIKYTEGKENIDFSHFLD